jgi:hypothetical protein
MCEIAFILLFVHRFLCILFFFYFPSYLMAKLVDLQAQKRVNT